MRLDPPEQQVGVWSDPSRLIPPHAALSRAQRPLAFRAARRSSSAAATIFDRIADTLARGGRVELRGFGAFTVKVFAGSRLIKSDLARSIAERDAQQNSS